MLYVAGEIFVWMALAFALGVLVGWFVWGLRQRKVAAKPAVVTAPAAASELESVTVRPVVRAADLVVPVSDAPDTPAAGTPVVPLAPPAVTPVPAVAPDDVPAAPTAAPEGAPAATGASATLAALVADDDGAAAWSEQPAWGAIEGAAPAAVTTPAGADDALGRLEDQVADAPDRGGAEALADDLTAAQERSAADNVAEARAATEPDLAAGSSALGKRLATDDLKVVEGVGPRIESILKESGIGTWSELAAASPERIRTILDLAGDQFRIHDPATWPHQASLAEQGRWDELVALQASLTGGKQG